MTLLYTAQSELPTPTRFCSHCNETKPADAFAPGHVCCRVCVATAREQARLRSIKVNETRTFGVEIECKVPHLSIARVAAKIRRLGIPCTSPGYTHHGYEAWKVVPDGTVGDGWKTVDGVQVRHYGMEVVSPILKGAAGVAELKKVVKLLNRLGAFADRACGLHVHHGARDLSLDSWKSLYRLYIRFEGVFDTVVPASRRGNVNSMCHALTAYGSEATVLARVDAAYDLHGLRTAISSRFVKLNVQSYWRHGTVEFRHFGGTTDFTKILNWVSLTQAMVEKAHAGLVVGPRVTPTADKLFGLVKPQRSVRKWFTDRAAAFAAAA